MTRLEFTTQTKRDAWLRSGFACEGVLSSGERCSVNLRQKRHHYDHIIACGFKGANDLSNCQVLCIPCHAEKTRKDVRFIAKAKRISDKHQGIKKPRKITSWRKFDGSIVVAPRQR